MAAANLVEPEFVAHLFAPLDGPHAADALAGVRTLWENCHVQLGMTQPIVEAGLRADLPADLVTGPDAALAGRQDPAVQFQAIVRREHDVLNLSFAIAALDAVPRPRPRLASSLPPGWHEFHRWWRDLGGGVPLLGGAVVLLAKTPEAAEVDLRAAVPAQEDDADRWWDAGFPLRGFAAWETTPAGAYESRRMVLLAGLDEDVELSRFAWSDGGTALPPLGRYLMHASKLRYEARVRGDGTALARLRQRVDRQLDELTNRLRDAATADPVAAGAAGLAGDEAELVAALAALRHMRRSVEVARANMSRALAEPLPADVELAGWLTDQLADDIEFLEATRERAERVRAMLAPSSQRSVTRPNQPMVQPVSTPPGPAPAARAEHRIGFDIDVVGYSSRSTPQQSEIQARLAGMTERVLAELDVALHDTDRQQAGDGMMVVLPPSVAADVALPKLLHGWRAHLVGDNAAHPEDRIRLRLSVGSGPFTRAAIGFAGQAIIGIGRQVDSEVLRRAAAEHPDADMVALVSDRIYQDVVGEGYPGLRSGEFELVEVTVKAYSARAWLWTGGVPPRRPDPSAPPDETPPSGDARSPDGRDVFVMIGPDEDLRHRMFALLRALGLRPLGWEEMVTRTGKGAPYPEDVFAAAFAAATAALVVMTPDDLRHGHSDVVMRAGRALALRPDHTILVQVGQVDRVADLSGRDIVQLVEGTDHKRTVFQHQIAERLRIVGYRVDTTGTDWFDPARFSGLPRPSTG